MITTCLLFCVSHLYNESHVGEIHSHPCYELVYYINGSGTVEFNNYKYSFKKNDYMVCGKDIKHLEIDEKGTEVLYIGFDVFGDNTIEEGLFQDDNNEILNLLLNIYNEIKRNNQDTSLQIANHFTNIIALKLVSKNKINKEDNAIISYNIDNITQYIIENSNKNIKVSELSSLAGYSYDHFRKAFKKRYGISVNEFILKQKLELANSMIKSGEFLVKEIAVACGFKSTSQFCTFYKNYTDLTPKKMIIRVKEDNRDIEKDKFSKI